MKIDLHSHTRGSDGVSAPAEIAAQALEAGLDGVALTDHHANVQGDNDEVYRVAEALRDVGVTPFIGVEYSTEQGHLLIFGVDVPREAWGRYPEMQAVIDDVNAMGGACVAAHPYKGYRRSLKDGIFSLSGLAAVEGLNGQCQVREALVSVNDRARAAAEYLGLPATGGSDAHWARALGTVWTEFPGQTLEDDLDLVSALWAGNYYPVVGPRVEAERQRLSARREASWAQGSWSWGVGRV